MSNSSSGSNLFHSGFLVLYTSKDSLKPKKNTKMNLTVTISTNFSNCSWYHARHRDLIYR